MSLRDQLLKKGLVSTKRARQIDRELKQQRKKKQGQRDKQRDVLAREAAEAKAREEQLAAARRESRLAAARARAALEREGRLRQIALSNQIRDRGKVVFHHRSVDGGRVIRREVHPRVAWMLRAGEAAIVAVRWGDRPVEYVVVNAGAADELAEIDASLVVFRVDDTAGISAPDEAFVDADWEPSLRARRATQADIERLRAAATG